MTKRLVLILALLIIVGTFIAACAAPVTPTPTPRPTTAPTPLPPPTVTRTAVPPTPTSTTSAPTIIPTTAPTSTPAVPTMTPTRTRVPATPLPAATATPVRPPSPKGAIVYHRRDSNGVDRLFAVNVETNVTTAVVDSGPVMDVILGTNAHIGEFSPDNTRFAYVFTGDPNGSNFLRVVDFRQDQTANTRNLFSTDAGGAGISSPSWSPDGNRIAFVWMRNNQSFWAVGVINADGTGRTDIRTNTRGEQFRGGLSWSKQNVLALTQNMAGPNDIFTLFSDGGTLTNRTNHPADDSTPAWSPDGKLIAFTSNRDGRQQIYVMNADGTGVRRVSQSTVNDFSPTWSPDGNWIAFASFRENSTDIYMMDLRGGNVKRLTTGGGDRPSWSH